MFSLPFILPPCSLLILLVLHFPSLYLPFLLPALPSQI
jgi:hypothetical protein